jgi:hypothetical protein
VRALFTHAHIQKKEREMERKREGNATGRFACGWMALSIPTHRVGSENAKNAACKTETGAV